MTQIYFSLVVCHNLKKMTAIGLGYIMTYYLSHWPTSAPLKKKKTKMY